MGKTVRTNPLTHKKEREKYYAFEHKWDYWEKKFKKHFNFLRKKDEKKIHEID